MDTLVVDPYHTIAAEFFSDRKVLKNFMLWKNQESFEEFERGEIGELEFFRNYYKNDIPDEARDILPRPEKIKKRMYKSVKFLPGMQEVIERLSKVNNIQLGMASNYSEWYTEIFIKQDAIEKIFNYFFISCEMGVRKPSEDYYFQIFNTLKKEISELRSEEIFFIDDRDKNLIPARTLNWQVHLMRNSLELEQAIDRFLD